MAMLNTQIATGVGGLSWMFVEWYVTGVPTVIGLCSGAVSGLVAITPAAGYVNPNAAFFFGLFCGPVCYYGCKLKEIFSFYDPLDSFGVHAVGGALGSTLVRHRHRVNDECISCVVS